jgi:hypothetical protein
VRRECTLGNETAGSAQPWPHTVTPSKGVSFTEVCRLAARLPKVTESTSYGTPALKVSGKLFARLKEDGETLVLKMDFVNRDLLIHSQPEFYFITDHYRDYEWMLVRLSRVPKKDLRDLLEDAWRLAAPRRLRAAHDADAAGGGAARRPTRRSSR